MAERLRRKGYQEEVITELIDYLRRLNYLNDLDFAKSWARNRMSTKPIGISLLSYELKTKGVSGQIVDEIIQQIEADYDEYELAEGIAARRAKRYSRLDRFKSKRRVYDYLKRRGFSSEVISKVMKKVYKDYDQ